MPLEPGQTLLHYRLVEKVGEGGMGVVWRAIDTTLGRDVAIKVLPEGLSGDPTRLQRFEREARLLASLNHPNVATVHGLEQAGDERFLVMEFVVGRTIADLLAFGGAWTLEDALPLMRQMTYGLEAAHGKGIIHRDLKPANVQLSSDDRIKILDFGLAKVAEDLPQGPISAESPTWVKTPTMSGMVVGTMTYMSPEQIEGRPLDARSDLFQLGMVFFEMLTGRHPFHGETAVDVQHAILREPPHLEQLQAVAPDEVVRIVSKLLEKDREYRYPDAEAVGVDLKTVHRASDPAWSSGSHSGMAPRRSKRARGPALVAAAVVTAAIGGLALWLGPWRTPPPPSATPSRLVPIVTAAGDGSTPSFSPDGNSVVFASNRGGNWDLWVSLVTGGNMIQVTDTPEQEFHPAWSPDGKRVAFTRYPSDDGPSAIWVAPALGGTARKIVDDGSDPAWSPDGREIAFVRDAEGSCRIFRVAIGAQDGPRPVTAEEDGIFHRDPAWTPDGRAIVFARSLGGLSGRLMRIPAGGGEAVPIVDDADGVMSAQPAITPDGRFVVHASDRGGTINLWRIPIDGRGDPERVTFGPGPDTSPVVSPDGRRIAYVNSRRDPRVVFVTEDGEDVDLVDRLEGGVAWHPVLSPDGSTIAVSRKAPGEPWRMQTVSREGGTLATVLEVEYDTLWPQFHPDGERLVFFTWPGRHRVGVVPLDGSSVEWLTDGEVECGYPAVSPDGAWLAYARSRTDEDKTDVVIRPFEGGEERVLVEGATVPVFSPDGTMLAFAGGRTPSGRIGVVAIDGGPPRWLTTSGTWPTWMPDGRAIAYADRTSDGPQVARAVPVDGGEPRTISTYRWPGTNFPFSIDPRTGRILTTNMGDADSSLWLAEYD